MSNRMIGVGVVMAGFVASAAVTAYVMREPVVVVAPEAPLPEPPRPAATLALSPASVPAPDRTPVLAPSRRSALASSTPVKAVSAKVSDPVNVEPAPEAPTQAPVVVPDSTPVPHPIAPSAPPEPEFDELTVEKHAVIGIRLDHAISSRTANVEDRVSAVVTRNVMVDGRVAIAEGARLEGTITSVERGGKFRDRPRVSLQFDTMILTDGTRMSVRTDTIVREGDSPSADAAARVGAGTAAGAILGSVLGGKKGAVIGGVTGAAAGTATVMSGDGYETALKAGTPLTVRLTEALVVLVRR